MTSHPLVRLAIVGALLGLAVTLSGCTSAGGGHRVAANQGVHIQCTKCYDAVVESRRMSTKHPGAHSRFENRHVCADCAGTAVVVEQKDGTFMFRCSDCAPNGVACDLCLPPAHGR